MRVFKITAVVLITAFTGLCIYGYTLVFMPLDGIETKKELKIPPKSDLTDVYTILKLNGIEPKKKLFNFLSNKMNYKGNIKHGLYEIEKKSSLINLIRKLRSGKQKAVKVTIHNENTRTALAKKVSSYLGYDHSAYKNVFHNDSILQTLNLDSVNFMSHIIPNSYYLYYYTAPTEFLKRMKKEHSSFWEKNNRTSKANELSLTPHEVYTLASIVERETQYKPERPTIAGVYLNRLEKGIALQADPTVLYAIDKPNASRVLSKYLEVDSPYNTYKYPGLPPGPIGTASISSLDAVLNAEDHDYYYFCAKADNSGKHVFAKSLSMHLQNARKFQKWLNSRGIYR